MEASKSPRMVTLMGAGGFPASSSTAAVKSAPMDLASFKIYASVSVRMIEAIDWK